MTMSKPSVTNWIERFRISLTVSEKAITRSMELLGRPAPDTFLGRAAQALRFRPNDPSETPGRSDASQENDPAAGTPTS